MSEGNKTAFWSRYGLPWLLPVLLIVLWQLLGSAGMIADRILPTPLSIAKAAVRLSESGQLLQYVGVSTQRALIGFIIGGGIGFVLGFLNGIVPLAEKLTDTSVQMIRNIPHLALIPLVILWFGIGEEAKIFIVALGVAFPIYLNTLHGIRSVDSGLVEMGRTYGLNGWELFRKIILPGALPSILVGVRFALGIMWISLIVAETISSDAGIGYMAMNAREFMQMDVVVLSILLYALLGKLSDWLAKRMERSWLKWHPHYRHNP
ncbi:aliphatic sulfonate ABC transporter permease SsuC [Paenibacillus mendelii]|uniref:Aliphatic sulfonate ABC transporter permease SsuC n=1 Tax=Paenibacillus mendelii TaxID=206163 RepID=A0ABV6JG51_9BACL|nr:aliphatic sulfonate ABC transporter permease SsuC [Paenibacillus mendelii]MCQ6562411.1 aliphatic sulfonate ABC transporter permease SsuC [Paenibacillus mendelii]